MVEERGKPLLPILSCCLSYPLQRAGRTDPALRPGCVALEQFVRAFGVIFGLELIVYLLPVGTDAFRASFGQAWFQLPFVALVAPAALIGIHRIGDREERRFWRAIAASGAAIARTGRRRAST